jgi:hypothetical protein
MKVVVVARYIISPLNTYVHIITTSDINTVSTTLFNSTEEFLNLQYGGLCLFFSKITPQGRAELKKLDDE